MPKAGFPGKRERLETRMGFQGRGRSGLRVVEERLPTAEGSKGA